jgi:hypothetical protein
MNIHEFQAKDLMRQYGVPVPAGSVAHSVEQAAAVAEELGVSRFVIKAQIHAGGRGKAGGVKLAHTVDEVRAATDEMIGRSLITAQTAPQGQRVQRVLIEQAVDIAREAYFGLVIDRASQRITIIACDGGGVEIEETARNEPARILREAVDPAVGLLDFQCRKVAAHLSLGGKQLPAAVKLMKALYRCFRDNDAVLIEVNPLAVTLDGRLLALDAKMQFDDNAIYRRPHISNLRDFDEEDPRKSKPARMDSTTSRWRGMSVASSTAPVSPWPRWTPSPCTAGGRRIFSTSVAAPRRKKSPTRFASCCWIRTSRRCWSTSSPASTAATGTEGTCARCVNSASRCRGIALAGNVNRARGPQSGRNFTPQVDDAAPWPCRHQRASPMTILLTTARRHPGPTGQHGSHAENHRIGTMSSPA